MHFATIVCLCISTASAVNHYGLLPTEDVRSMIEQHVQKFMNDDLTITSIFTTDSHNTHDGADFLTSELGIFNKTVFDIFTPSAHRSSALEPRSPVDNECKNHGNIEDNLSQDQIGHVCNGMAAAAGTGVSGIITVVESKICVEAGTGHTLNSCKTIVSMFNFASSTLAVLEVKQYCPRFLSFFVKCKGADAEGHAKRGDIEMTAFNSQKDYNCDKANKEETKCVESHVG